MRPDPTQSARLFAATVMPFVALSGIAGLVNALREARVHHWFDQGVGVLALERIREQVQTDVLFALAAGAACFAALWVACLIGDAATRLAPFAWAALICLLGTRALFPDRWRVFAVRDGLPLPAFLSDYSVLAKTKLVFAALMLMALVVALMLWRRRSNPAFLWNSPTMRRLGLASGTMALLVTLGATLAPMLDSTRLPDNPVPVIYLTWDSTRADHLSCYGYPRPTSPNLDALAADGLRYRTAISPHNWTRPAYASIFAGVPYWMLPQPGLDPSVLSLTEIMKSRGYRTAGLVQNPNLDSELHFDQGFDRFTELHALSGPALMNRFVIEEVRRLAASEEPFFLFAHYQEPHWPYPRDNPFLDQFVDPGSPPVSPGAVARLMKHNGKDWDPEAADAAATIASMKGLYDASIRLTDEHLGELIAVLKELGLYERALIVFNSDHGDEFGEHGAFGHAHDNVHPELTYVPLIVRLPSIAPRVVEQSAQSLDILPTVLAVTGIEPPGPLPGVALIKDGRDVTPPDRLAYSNRGGLVAVRDGNHSLVVNYESGEAGGLFDSPADPLELRPLDTDHSAYAPLRQVADGWYREYLAKAKGESGEVEMSEELLERLRSLGYVD